MAGFFDTLFGGAAGQQAQQADTGFLQQYGQGAGTELGQAYTTGTRAINQGVGAYQPLANLGATYAQGASPYMAALGVGSPDAIAQAQQNFQNTPGFQAQLQNAQQAVARQRAIGGMGASGNADIDQILGQAGITGNAYQNYVQNLLQSQQLGAQTTGAAAQGQAGQYDALANLAQNYGQNMAGVYGNIAQGQIGAENQAMADKAAGAKNLLGAGLSLATLAAGGNPFGGSLTGGGGGGGFGSSLLGQLGSKIGGSFGWPGTPT